MGLREVYRIALALCAAVMTRPAGSRLVINSDNYTCSGAEGPLNDYHFRGTSLGGWLVLEPWITPTLFYQFLGATERWGAEAPEHVGMDSYSFCTALGDEEANRQLRQHWEAWVTEEDIASLAASGVDTLRLPVGDFMFREYEPYVGCFDGAVDELHRVLSLIDAHGMKAVIDVHTMVGSQSGLDNSGVTVLLEWTRSNETLDNTTRFQHWPIRSAGWVGDFDLEALEYKNIKHENLEHAVEVIRNIVDMLHDHPAVVGLEPVNEPWEHTPMHLVKQFYFDAYEIVQEKAPHWVLLLHDSFRLSAHFWKDFLRGCPNYGFDTHIYQAWAEANSATSYISDSCAQYGRLQKLEEVGMPVIVGEWSLATDNCAMWLNGFNDNVYGFPQVECERVTCPPPYMGEGMQPGAPPDPSLPAQDPFGTGNSYVEYGTCPRGRPFEDEDKFMTNLAAAKLKAFDAGHGFFFWNFKTDVPEYRWSFLLARERGYLPHMSAVDHVAGEACHGKGNGTIPGDEIDQEGGANSAVLLTAGGLLLVVVVAVGVTLVRWRARGRNEGYERVEMTGSRRGGPRGRYYQHDEDPAAGAEEQKGHVGSINI